MYRLLTCLMASAFLQGAFGQDNSTTVMITLFATDLNGCDDLSACDAVTTIMCTSSSSDWRKCGETSEIKDDNFPLWSERFTFDHVPSQNLRWRFDVVDKDVLFDDKIGTASVSVEDFLKATEVQTTMNFDLGGRGRLYVHKRQL